MSAVLGNYVSDNPSDLGKFMTADIQARTVSTPSLRTPRNPEPATTNLGVIQQL